MDLMKRKRINVSIAIFIIWIFGISLFFFFTTLIKVDLLPFVLVLFFETSLCLIIWIFFMLRIEWLKDMNTGKEIMYLNISNILSAIRFSLVPLLITMFGLISENHSSLYIKIIIFVFGMFVCLTDLFDGMLARKFNEVTKLGMILDPVGDFLMITCFSVLIFLKGIMFWWFFVLIMIRIPGLFLIMIFFILIKFKYQIKTTLLGRTTIFFILGFLGLATFKLFLKEGVFIYDTFLFVAQIIGAILIIFSSIEKVKLVIYYFKNQEKLSSNKNLENLGQTKKFKDKK